MSFGEELYKLVQNLRDFEKKNANEQTQTGQTSPNYITITYLSFSYNILITFRQNKMQSLWENCKIIT